MGWRDAPVDEEEVPHRRVGANRKGSNVLFWEHRLISGSLQGPPRPSYPSLLG